MGPVAVGGLVVLNVPESAARLNIMSGREVCSYCGSIGRDTIPSCRSGAWAADMSDEAVLVRFQGSQTPWAIPGPCSAGLPGAYVRACVSPLARGLLVSQLSVGCVHYVWRAGDRFFPKVNRRTTGNRPRRRQLSEQLLI